MSWLLTPIGRWLSSAMAVLAGIGAIYLKGRRDAKATLEQKAQADALTRTQNSLRAGDAVRTDAGRLRDDDGHRRD